MKWCIQSYTEACRIDSWVAGNQIDALAYLRITHSRRNLFRHDQLMDFGAAYIQGGPKNGPPNLFL